MTELTIAELNFLVYILRGELKENTLYDGVNIQDLHDRFYDELEARVCDIDSSKGVDEPIETTV
jgi:hypothetical protein